ncbi:TonB-dependent receptor [bacterium]|nr:TonB-dependent receptor [bacterium]
MKTSVVAIVVIVLSVSLVSGQAETPDLKLDVYQIVGKDTRVFTITGDRYSTVSFVNVPVVQTPEERSIETSKGLIGEDERLVREEVFLLNRGVYGNLDAESGIKTPLILWAKGSADLGKQAGTLVVSNRMANQHTPLNEAPLIQDVEAAGYYDGSFARLSVDGMFGREDDELDGRFFRNHDRNVGRYRAGMTMRMSPLETWDASGRLTVMGASYKDADILRTEENEFVFAGNGRITGDLGSTTVVAHASGSRIELGDFMGTIFSADGVGEWLLGDSFGVKAGFAFSASRLPDEDTVVRLYPRAGIDWALSPDMYVRADFKSGVSEYSFSRLYGLNGLITYDVPMLFEDRKIDVSGEFGLSLQDGINMSVGGFYISSENMPVFTSWMLPADSSVVFYRIFDSGVVDMGGIRLKGEYDSAGHWGVDGCITLTSATCDSTDNVPYIPGIEAALNGFYLFRQVWKFRGTVQFYGEHYTEPESDNTEDAFFTVDIGVDRELFRDRLGLCVEVRNLTGEKGAWWTSPYHIPGIGLYAGLKATY